MADLSPTPFVRNFRVPDKLGASIMTGGAVVAALYGLWRIEPILIDLAENTIYLLGMALVLVLGVSTLWQSREAIWYFQQNQIRKFRRSVIGEDPIGILETVIKRLRRKIEEIQESMASTKAALDQQVAAINQATKEAGNEARLATVAKDQGKPLPEIKQHAMSSTRWKKAAEELKPDAEKMGVMQVRYQEALDLAEANMADADNQKKVMALKVRTTAAKKKAFAAFKTMFGQSDEWQMWGDAIEIIEQRSYEAEAQIDQLLQSVTPQIASQKLQQEADAQDALRALGLITNEPLQLPEGGDVVNGEIIATGSSTKATVRR